MGFFKRFSRYCACAIYVLTAVVSMGEQRAFVVALDGYHKNESKPHYRWEGTYSGGYSELATLLDRSGFERRTLTSPLLQPTLVGVDCLIIVAPDTSAQAADPKYISENEVQSVVRWVKGGGVLLMLGNDPGHAEFPRFNALAAQFGIQFLEQTHKDAKGSVKLTLTAGPGQHAFRVGSKFYAVQVAPVKITNPKAQILLQDNSQVIMAVVPFGRGRVLALGDPWLYNEYIHAQDNYQMADELFSWLFASKKSPSISDGE